MINQNLRLAENQPYEVAVKAVMEGKDFEVGMRRMDEKHRSTKPNIPDTKFITKQDESLWRSTDGGGRPARIGKGRQVLWYTFRIDGKAPKKAKAKAEAKLKIVKRKKAIPKSKLKLKKGELEGL